MKSETLCGWDLQSPGPYIFSGINLSNLIHFPPSVGGMASHLKNRRASTLGERRGLKTERSPHVCPGGDRGLTSH